MKTTPICRLLTIVVFYGVGRCEAQVPNDDCTGSFAQWIIVPQPGSSGCTNPMLPFGVIISDSTDLALAEFPYPTNPLPCFGYTSSIVAPANDRWYAFRVNCDLLFEAQCTDTCHLSFWSGASCTTLTPRGCYTLLPNTSHSDLVSSLGLNPAVDTLSLQISGHGIGTSVHYSLCLSNPSPPCTNVAVSPGPTPVTCLTYEFTITAASSPAATDGSISIVVQLGNGPFQILWGNGATTSIVDGLASGYYPLTIMDALGCVTNDTLFLPIDDHTGYTPISASTSGSMRYNAQANALSWERANAPNLRKVMILDMLGRVVWETIWTLDAPILQLPDLQIGSYCAVVYGAVSTSVSLKFTITISP